MKPWNSINITFSIHLIKYKLYGIMISIKKYGVWLDPKVK